VECFDTTTGKTVTLAAEHCGFGYRDSVFKGALRGRVIITAVSFELSLEPRPNLRYAALAERVARAVAGSPPPEGWQPKADGMVTLEALSRAVTEIRNSKLPDPRKTPNAGSFFKNPVVDTSLARELATRPPGMPLYPAPDGGHPKLSAGWLIEQAGWRGRSEGRVGIHPDQALIVVNLGGATGSEIIAFAQKIQNDVKQKFGVSLTPEVNRIG
jgi:UDP-N-acetylmuramate dehydrogenase